MRLFVAIELVEELKRELVRVQSDLARLSGGGLRLMPRENLHLTLKFIGELNSDQLGDAKELIHEIARSAHVFGVSLREAGVFPPQGPLRVCWVGVHAEDPLLANMSRALENSFELLNIPAEQREFRAHITVARSGRGTINSEQLRSFLRTMTIGSFVQEVKGLTLFSSELSSSGSTYRVVERVLFEG